ncbi:hypothetical protein NV379_10595 [Paenibacillus sp. N1-5-1-14]|uniref:hypothetical protein n=1 Tax=Paenibacillus radicibacter TaxID=2972488 RepID=UPI002159AF2C|nr:hypothetical protein [Paenibacillus radicibacter]MCR8643107.1 hypothetical protein [Paenibacillus radicibacter]
MKKLVMVTTSVVLALSTLSSAAFAEQATSLVNGKPFAMKGIETKPNTYVIQQKWADLNHDGEQEHIILIGTKEDPGDSYVENLNLVVQDGKTSKIKQTKMTEYSGYAPYISFVGDFNGDHKEDVMLTIDPGDDSIKIMNRIFSFAGDEPKVIFEDATKDRNYYLLDPVDQNSDGIYELVGTTRVHGEDKTQTLGFEQSTLAYDKSKGTFVVKDKTKKATMKDAINQYHSKIGGYTFIIPRGMSKQVKVYEADAAKLKELGEDAQSATYIEYTPKHKDADGKQYPEFLASFKIYDKAYYQQHQDGPGMGEVVADEDGKVVTWNTPQSNPFEPGGEDYANFDEQLKYFSSLTMSFYMNGVTNDYHSEVGGYSFVLPTGLSKQVKVSEVTAAKLKEDGDAAVSATRIDYTPVHKDAEGKQSPAFLASLKVYDKAYYEQHKNEPDMGTVVLTNGAKVIVLNAAQSNPFEPDSEDYKLFESQVELLSNLKESLTITPVDSKDGEAAKQKLKLTQQTSVFDAINGKILFSASPQEVTVVSKKKDPKGNEWIEIVTWLGNSWIKAPQASK